MAALDKIKKLLALAADDAASEQERETAGRQAASLMAKHEIDEFDLLMAEGKEWELIEQPVQSTRPGKRTPASKVPPWINVIAYGVKLWCNVRVDLRGPHMVFKGTRSNVELAKWMHEALVNACYTASKGHSNSNAFRNGYAGAIQVRLKAMCKERDSTPESSGTGTSLVLVRSRLEEVMNERWGAPSGSKKVHTQRSMDGYNAGQGASIPMHRPMSDARVQGYLK
jgi:hypothetical protein